ncbi:MAG: MFS transporter [Micromonosporaceae bacterium]|nr:MFS transporter [Micromonosporaceae bacterium]
MRRDPDFQRYAAARVASLIGSAITYIAMPVLIYQMTGSNLWTAFAVVAETLPYVCLGLFAGALADRVDRRRVMITSDVVSGVLLASVPVAYFLGGLTAPHALAVGFVSQASFVFFDAANFGALPTLAGVSRIAAAQSFVFGASTAVELVVPGLVGAALAVVAPGPLLALDAISFLASALLIRAIARPLWDASRASAAPRRLGADIRDGLRFLWGHPIVRINVLVGMTQSFSGGAFVGQLVPWADQVLGVPPGDRRLGLMFTAWAVGSLGASALYPRLSRWRGEAWVTLLALPLSALGAMACALARDWWVAVAFVAAWGVVYVTVIINSITLRQRITPEHLQSRVNTTGRMLAYGVGSVSGALTAGVVSEAAGPRTALALAAGVTAAGAVAAWLSPLRRHGLEASARL